jgi:hypothetical protein
VTAVADSAPEAIGGQLGQRLVNRGGRCGRHGVARGGKGWGLLRDHLGDDRLRGRAEERRVARQHLVGDRPERVHVAARADLALAHRLLGAHVVGSAERHAGLGHPGATRLAGSQGDAEIRHQRLPVVQQDVLGLDVAMDDAVAVGIVERAGHLARDGEGLADGQLLLAGEPVAQRFAFDERHDVEEEPVDLARIEERQDMRVLQVRGGPDLGQEPLGADHGRQLGAQQLEGDRAAVPDIVGQVDRGHPAGTELAVEPVAIGERGL